MFRWIWCSGTLYRSYILLNVLTGRSSILGEGEFEWDDGNVDHISKHDVEPWEAEEVIFDPERVDFSAHSGRAGVIGKTVDGRFLVVVIERGGKLIRVVTAREARANEKKTYRKRNR